MSPERLQEVRDRVQAGAAPRHTALWRSCYACRQAGRPDVHPVEEFTQRANGSYFSACKSCNRDRQKAARLAKKEANNG